MYKIAARWLYYTKTRGGPYSIHDPDRDFVDRYKEVITRGYNYENPKLIF
jgi:hypothetical protein